MRTHFYYYNYVCQLVEFVLLLILSSSSVSLLNTVSIIHRFELAKIVITLCTVHTFYNIVVNPFISLLLSYFEYSFSL